MFVGAASRKIHPLLVDIPLTAQYIKSVQKKSGEIPWSVGGKTDPWDHIESAMGLSVAGLTKEAQKAYLWLADIQMNDGSFWAYYENEHPAPNSYKDTNMIAYLATGILHYYLITNDLTFVQDMWPFICKAIDFVCNKQGTEGQMYWAETATGQVDKLALLTGSSSIFLSLNCAIRLATILGEKHTAWEDARMWLGKAIRCKRHLFDRSKSNYSMDWYYPVLCGILTGQDAEKRIDKYWQTFAVNEWGIKCVSEQPWVTMAETAELVMSLAAMGNYSLAEEVLSWIQDKQYDDGAYWMGVTFPDNVIYTDEKTAWTGAAVLLASDMLYGLTPACRLFQHGFFKTHRLMYSI